MQKSVDIKGQCLCGTVKYSVKGEISSFHLCYCSRCRLATGSAHASNMFSQPHYLTWISGENNIQRYELESAKSFAKQFCRTCGSAVPYINRSKTFLVIPAGTVVDGLNVIPDDRIFCASKASWIEAIPDTVEFSDYPDKF
ncbi:GFA family protein [Aurantivibrio infirmus]